MDVLIFLLEFKYLSNLLWREVRFLFKNKPVPFARRHSAYAWCKIEAVAGQHLNNYKKQKFLCYYTRFAMNIFSLFHWKDENVIKIIKCSIHLLQKYNGCKFYSSWDIIP